MNRALVLTLLIAVFPVLSSAADTVAPKPVLLDQIASAWSHRPAEVEITWHHNTDGVFRFHRYQAEWLPGNENAAAPRATLNLDSKHFRFKTVRWAAGEHGYKNIKQVSATVAEMFPERTLHPYFAALAVKFADPERERGEPFPFTRVFDGQLVHDYWQNTTGPRGTISAVSPLGMAAQQAGDSGTPSQQLQDLALFAGFLAIYPLHPYVDVRLAECHVDTQSVHADGEACFRLIEAAIEGSNIERTFWVAPARDFAIRRFLAKGPGLSVQCDFEYVDDPKLVLKPTTWLVCLRSPTGVSPPTATRVTVTDCGAAEPLRQAEHTLSFPPATWVIDEPTSDQYITRENSLPRRVLPSDTYWLPTQAELAATKAGQVGELIESKISRKRYWRIVRLPLLTGFSIVATAMAFAIRRRQDAQTRRR